MRVERLHLLQVGILLTWLLLYVLDVALGMAEGACTVFLPVSLAALLLQQLRAERPPFDLSIVFLASCLFFFCIGIILWPVSSLPPTEFESLVEASFTMSELDYASFLIGISIAITMLAMSVCRNWASYRVPLVFTPPPDPRARILYRLGVAFMVMSLPAVVIESWMQFRYIQDAGYLALYVEGVPTSAWAIYFFYLFYFGFGLAFTFASTRRAFLGPATLYLVAATLDSLKGARGAVLVPLLFVAWYYCSRFDVKVRLGVVARNLALLGGLFVFMTYQRDPELLSGGIGQFLVDALSTQGRSLQLTILYQQHADEIARYGNDMVLSNLLIPFNVLLHPELRESAQSMDHVLYSNNLKHILTYVLNPDYYFAGGGTGGVYTVELIEAGAIMFIALSIGLGWMLAWLPGAMRRPWIRFLSIHLFATVFYLPRGEFFFNTLIVGKALFLYVLVICLGDVLRRVRGTAASRGTSTQQGTHA
ncbi:MAG TPA: O-antigen polysaccharide polymerase Wzy [Burkholderiaceae bacterium]